MEHKSNDFGTTLHSSHFTAESIGMRLRAIIMGGQTVIRR
jgi:hypothetical protein